VAPALRKWVVDFLVGGCALQAVTEEQVQNLSKKLGMPYFMVSAKQGLHVDEVCGRLVCLLCQVPSRQSDHDIARMRGVNEQAFQHAAEACVERLKTVTPIGAAAGGSVDLASAKPASGGGNTCCK